MKCEREAFCEACFPPGASGYATAGRASGTTVGGAGYGSLERGEAWGASGYATDDGRRTSATAREDGGDVQGDVQGDGEGAPLPSDAAPYMAGHLFAGARKWDGLVQ